ncbi:MAG: GNAT family N-acetyltransferase [Oscillospiraceae bacterium]
MEFLWGIKGEAVVNDAFIVRTRVFVDEQGFSIECELDDIDNTALHIVGYNDLHKPVCAARIFKTGGDTYHAGRIAVDKSLRGQGVGRKLINQIIIKVKELGGTKIELDAQYDKAAFYEKCGFVRTGKETLDEGYKHVGMVISLI